MALIRGANDCPRSDISLQKGRSETKEPPSARQRQGGWVFGMATKDTRRPGAPAIIVTQPQTSFDEAGNSRVSSTSVTVDN